MHEEHYSQNLVKVIMKTATAREGLMGLNNIRNYFRQNQQLH